VEEKIMPTMTSNTNDSISPRQESRLSDHKLTF